VPVPAPALGFGTPAFYAALGRAFVAMCAVVPVLFGIEAVDRLLGQRLDLAGGIQPRRVEGLDGIVLSPLLHANFEHVIGNSAPLILLGTFVLASGARRFLAATVFIALVGGGATWCFADPRTTIVGASGVIFGYLGMLLARGVVERSWWNVAVGLLIGLLYGWQLVTVLPVGVDERTSWQAHLFGFLAGLVAAVLFRRRGGGPEPAED
jgi:membrane associated rhomboid family serine protease